MRCDCLGASHSLERPSYGGIGIGRREMLLSRLSASMVSCQFDKGLVPFATGWALNLPKRIF